MYIYLLYTQNAPEWKSQGENIAQVSGNLSASKTNNNKSPRYVRNVQAKKKTRRKSFSQTQIQIH